MTCRHAEPIEVTSALADPDRAEPEAFIWQGRLFVVRAVLDRWRERRSWWREAVPERQRADRGQVDPEWADRGQVDRGQVDWGQVDWGQVDREWADRGQADRGQVDWEQAPRERQVWRVEASPGRAAGTGVYDLGSDGIGPDGSPRWLLLRAHD